MSYPDRLYGRNNEPGPVLNRKAAGFIKALENQARQVLRLPELTRKQIAAKGWNRISTGPDKETTIGYIAPVPGEGQTDVIVLSNNLVVVTRPREGHNDQYEKFMGSTVDIPNFPLSENGTVTDASAHNLLTFLGREKYGVQVVLSSRHPLHMDGIYDYIERTLGIDTAFVDGTEEEYINYKAEKGEDVIRALGLEEKAERLMRLPDINQLNEELVGRGIVISYPDKNEIQLVGYILPPTPDGQQLIVLNNGLMFAGVRIPNDGSDISNQIEGNVLEPSRNPKKLNPFSPRIKPYTIIVPDNEDLYYDDWHLTDIAALGIMEMIEKKGFVITLTSLSSDPVERTNLDDYKKRVMEVVERQIRDTDAEVSRAYDPAIEHLEKVLDEYGDVIDSIHRGDIGDSSDNDIR